MAKIDDILKLQEAGFTADDIAKLLPLVKDEQKVETVTVSQEQLKKPDVNLVAFEEKFNALIEKLEANALLKDKQPENETATSFDDIMAKIIEPKE